MVQPLQIQRFDFFALQDFLAPSVLAEDASAFIAEEHMAAPPPPPPPTFSEMEMERAKRAAFDEGVAEGMQRARDESERLHVEAEQRLAEQMRVLNERLISAAQVFEEQQQTQMQNLHALAYGIARKLAADSLKENAAPVLEAMLRHCLPHTLSHPALLIRVHPEAEEVVQTCFATLAPQAGYEGIMTLRSDDTLHLGDIRVEWQFGSAQRRLSTLLKELDTLFPACALPLETSSQESTYSQPTTIIERKEQYG
jgi:flagellar assembly protein FliH